jgi:hypothetical protein
MLGAELPRTTWRRHHNRSQHTYRRVRFINRCWPKHNNNNNNNNNDHDHDHDHTYYNYYFDNFVLYFFNHLVYDFIDDFDFDNCRNDIYIYNFASFASFKSAFCHYASESIKRKHVYSNVNARNFDDVNNDANHYINSGDNNNRTRSR